MGSALPVLCWGWVVPAGDQSLSSLAEIKERDEKWWQWIQASRTPSLASRLSLLASKGPAQLPAAQVADTIHGPGTGAEGASQGLPGESGTAALSKDPFCLSGR